MQTKQANKYSKYSCVASNFGYVECDIKCIARCTVMMMTITRQLDLTYFLCCRTLQATSQQNSIQFRRISSFSSSFSKPNGIEHSTYLIADEK